MRLSAGLLLCAVSCSSAPSLVDAGAADAGAADADAGRCHVAEPDLACIATMFRALDSGTLPFDAQRVRDALGANETTVAPGWSLTAHHVLEADSPFPYHCFFATWRYADAGQPFSGPGCGELLVAGGHPHASQCQGITPMHTCVDQVPFEEAFDLVLHRSPARAAWLDPASAPPAVGDTVYLVGNPFFIWLSSAERAQLSFPLVSEGKVLAVSGRGIVTSAAAYPGNSGGPLLDAQGRVVAVIYTRLADQRAQGTATPVEHEGWSSVGVLIDAPTRAAILGAR
ncbi:MAG: trypsin-like peptidase domain-containing protein [Archangiaceae bacterium]|nr:trypsin-like peptidase domain-containing protein [Archangiaceae bacterium]